LTIERLSVYPTPDNEEGAPPKGNAPDSSLATFGPPHSAKKSGDKVAQLTGRLSCSSIIQNIRPQVKRCVTVIPPKAAEGRPRRPLLAVCLLTLL